MDAKASPGRSKLKFSAGNLGLGLAGICLVSASALAGDPPASSDQVPAAKVWEFLPEAGFYPLYIADPLRPQSAVMVIWVPNSDIPETGNGRFSLRLGGQYPIVAFHPDGDPDRGWQLDFEGGFYGHFDIGHSLDNIGWDGLFGLLIDYKPRSDLAFRFGTQHDSAHVADEYAERTGRTRVGYTREEFVLGVSWQTTRSWRTYFEVGSQFGGDDFQEPWRAQAGVEYLGRRLTTSMRASWYAALDLRSYQENDWQPRVTGQAGLLIPTGRGRSRYRAAVEVASGRSVLGEFYLSDETYAGLGWYFDF
jgi:hypothetical protein